MSVTFTLAQLKTAIQNRVEDDGTEFAANLNTIIQLAENRIVRELPLTVWQQTGNVTITSGTQTATKPTNTVAVHAFYYVTGSSRVILEPRTYGYCLDYALTTTTGAPKYYAEDYPSETLLYIAPSPNLTVTAVALITIRPDSLVTDTGGTYISQKMGDMLLAASMVAAEQFDISPELVQMWEANYERLYTAAARDFSHLLPRNYTNMAPIPSALGKMER